MKWYEKQEKKAVITWFIFLGQTLCLQIRSVAAIRTPRAADNQRKHKVIIRATQCQREERMERNHIYVYTITVIME